MSWVIKALLSIKAANAKSREQWGHEVCSSNMYPMLSDNENWWYDDDIW